PVHDSARPFAVLAGLTVLYAVFALLRLWGLRPALTARVAAPKPVAPPAAAPGIAGAFAGEWRRLLATRSAFSILIMAPVIYGVFYPQPYLTQILHKVPIAVVDNDLSDLSRQIVQTLDASGAVSVAVRAE